MRWQGFTWTTWTQGLKVLFTINMIVQIAGSEQTNFICPEISFWGGAFISSKDSLMIWLHPLKPFPSTLNPPLCTNPISKSRFHGWKILASWWSPIVKLTLSIFLVFQYEITAGALISQHAHQHLDSCFTIYMYHGTSNIQELVAQLSLFQQDRRKAYHFRSLGIWHVNIFTRHS